MEKRRKQREKTVCFNLIQRISDPLLILLCRLTWAVESALNIAEAKVAASVSMPVISSGIFGYPVRECASVIAMTVVNFAKRATLLKSIRVCDTNAETIQLIVEFLKQVFLSLLQMTMLVFTYTRSNLVP